MAEPFLGQIMLCPYNFAPYGWADCAGQTLPISQNAALFSLIGIAYGGNGSSTFCLPDLQGRVALSQGQLTGGEPYSIGEPGGSESVMLLSSEMAPHTHILHANPGGAESHTPAGTMFAKPTKLAGDGLYAEPPATTTLSALTVAPAGSNASHNTMQPFLVLRYVIALQGIFPARP